MLPHIDVEALLERGEQASFVLAHPMFEGAMNDLANYHTVAMIEAPEGPLGADAREHHHRMLLACREIVDQLRGYEAAADEAKTALAAKED